jgi:pimeloyl-ACP methyl ester carboxylesterase
LQHLGVEQAHLVGQSYGGVILLQLALDAPDSVRSLALLEPALPSVLNNSPEFIEAMTKAGALYGSGKKADAVDAFGREVAGADYRADFDRTLPSGHFERWAALQIRSFSWMYRHFKSGRSRPRMPPASPSR